LILGAAGPQGLSSSQTGRYAAPKEVVVEAGGESGQGEQHKPSKKENCINSGCELACCFSSAVLVVLTSAGCGLVARAAKRAA
jgi:hypothetical protein